MFNNIIVQYIDTRLDYTKSYDLSNSAIKSNKVILKTILEERNLNKQVVSKGLKTRKQWWLFKRRNRFIRFRNRKLRKRTLIQGLYRLVKVAKVFVNISSNNTHVTITALDKHSIKRSIICSAGCIRGIKGTKRSAPLATEMVIKRALFILKKVNKQARIIHLYRSGVGRGRSVVRKAIIASRMKIHIIREVTAIPHNGTRKSSRRRV